MLEHRSEQKAFSNKQQMEFRPDLLQKFKMCVYRIFVYNDY